MLVMEVHISAAEMLVIVAFVRPLNHSELLEQVFLKKEQGHPVLSFKELIFSSLNI